jgi:hypothetical protein
MIVSKKNAMILLTSAIYAFIVVFSLNKFIHESYKYIAIFSICLFSFLMGLLIALFKKN